MTARAALAGLLVAGALAAGCLDTETVRPVLPDAQAAAPDDVPAIPRPDVSPPQDVVIPPGGRACTRACYGGWICDYSQGRCVAPPDTTQQFPLNPGDGTAGDSPPQSGPGSVTPLGGQVDRLSFGVFGDVRPGSINVDAGYPTATIGSIMAGMASHNAQFVVGTGDYMYSNTADSVKTQLDQLAQAEARFPGTVLHSMGNHECDGFTASNCVSLTQTPNITGFMQRLIPFATQPYYAVTIGTSMGTAKVVVIAANFWNADQAAWLDQTLAVPTTYTFVVRHEPSDTPQTPGVLPSDAIIANHPLTLALFGHEHTYRRVAVNAVVSGNGGAPMSSAGSFGYLMVRQLGTGNIAVTEFAQGTDMPLDTWTLTPAGVAVTP